MAKSKWMYYGLGVIFIVLIVGVVYFVDINKDNNKTEKTFATFKEEYESYNDVKNDNGQTIEVSIPEKNTIKNVNEDEILSILEEKTGIVYFGFPTCPWCRNIIGVLTELANEKNITIYYFNPQNIRNESNGTYQKLVKKLDSYLDKDENGNKVLYVPDVYFVKDGKIIGHHLGSLDEQTNPYESLTKEQEFELKEIYLNYINKLKK